MPTAVQLPEVLFVSMNDPGDVRTWSGTEYHMVRMLRQLGHPVEELGDLLRDRRLFLKALQLTCSWFTGRKPAPVDRRTNMAARFAARVEEHLRTSRAQFIFSPSSIPLAMLRSGRPKIFHTDATFSGIIGQYPELASFAGEFVQEGHELERMALRNCDMAIYSSSWAARSAIEEYGADPSHVRVIPFGSNLGHVPSAQAVAASLALRSREQCRLLFIGVHWQRKGGDMAVNVARAVRAMGLPVSLQVIGCTPPADQVDAHMEVLPFLDKRRPSDLAMLMDHIRKSHFLILPSTADCTPIVINECNAWGVPCMVSDVGGIPEMVIKERNGHVFARNAPPSAYASRIIALMSDRSRYEELAWGAFEEHSRRLSWNATGQAVEQVLERIGDRRAELYGAAMLGQGQ
jgi:glycosyltransferase involved in cell wall biosynthesis